MTDPAVQAVADALMASDRFTHGDVKGVARVAVDAYRRQVLASRLDAELVVKVEKYLAEHAASFGGYGSCWIDRKVPKLLAALADETAARQAAEADVRRQCAAELRAVLLEDADWIEMESALRGLADSWEVPQQ